MGTFQKSIGAIKLKYLWPWLKDQLGHRGWFRRLFIDRTAWGAFSIYAHLKKSNGEPKTMHRDRQKAVKQAESLAKSHGASFEVYKCLFCEGWHVSRVMGKEEKKQEAPRGPDVSKYQVTVTPRAGGLDVDRIMATGIPDLAPVYGGFRGRTLSSPKQLPAWKTMLESGICQIIDLRADYKSDFYQELCERSSIAYYHFPIAYDEASMDNMVKEFPMFCSLIDKGGFYIACAMGLHRTDIALCTYWVFHAANKGIAPPPIRGYRKDKGLDTNKIMRILNGFYKRITTEETAVPVISEPVFKERKNIIIELSKNAQ